MLVQRIKKIDRGLESLHNNDWIYLNSIIYKIYSIDDSAEMRMSLIDQLRMLINFDFSTFYLGSKENRRVLVNPVVFNVNPQIAEIYSNEYENVDYSKSLMFTGKSIIYRETDIILDEKRVETEYYKLCYAPFNAHYSVTMVLSYNHMFLGAFTLFRYQGKTNFEYDDLFILEMLKDHLELRLNNDINGLAKKPKSIIVNNFSSEFGLTKSEESILQAMSDGYENDVICENLYITKNTLKKHILNIYRKMGVKSRVQLFKLISDKCV